jgi:hypothetical protein
MIIFLLKHPEKKSVALVLVSFHKHLHQLEVNARKVTSKWTKYKFGLNQQSNIFLFPGLAWAIWNVRNKMMMQSKFPRQ